MAYLPIDKIRIFVSSTLQECKEEREVAKRAVISLNHDPVMFEAAGARPHPPRSVYLRGLENAHIFVGIYREQYGFIAEGMSVSGLEDEFRYATARGLPPLLYVKRDCTRTERLEALVTEMKGPDFTIGHYQIPEELYELLRDNIAALVAEYCVGGLTQKGLRPTPAGQLVEQLAPPKSRIARTNLEASFLRLLSNDNLVTLHAPGGAGKTVFLAGLAERNNWAFVQAGDRAIRDIVSEAANELRARLGLQATSFNQPDDAKRALVAAWQALSEITLVLDDVRDEDTVEPFRNLLTRSATKRIVTSTRIETPIAGSVGFSLPAFDRNEIEAFISAARSAPLQPDELSLLIRLSNGNPLYLRYYAAGEPGHFEDSLRDLEHRAWNHLSSRAREAATYIALSPRPLTIEQLLTLMESEKNSIEDISEQIALAGNLLLETTVGFSIFHPHSRETFRALIVQSPQKHNFYARRLGRWFTSKRDYSAAFSVLEFANAPISTGLLDRAASHAAVHGDVKMSLSVLSRGIKLAKERGDNKKAGFMLVGLAQTLSHAGHTQEALSRLEEAKALADDRDFPISIEEMRLSILTWARGDVDARRRLTELKSQYISENRLWDAARISLDLSAAFIRGSDYKSAVAEAEFALKTFQDFDDMYGISIAKLNFVSAGSMVPEKAEEAKRLFAELEATENISPRQRAALCNILGRRARENDDTEGAKQFAREAIQIGEQLGDASVICTNLINLGNAFRQEKKLDVALEQYEKADKHAREAGFTQLEAAAQELIASIFNRKGDGARAVHHAFYAIGLAKDGISPRTEIQAREELARGYANQNNQAAAASEWLRVGSLELIEDPASVDGFQSFLRGARIFYQQKNRSAYISGYKATILTAAHESGESQLDELVGSLPDLVEHFPVDLVFEMAAYHARLLFDDLPAPLARQAYLRSVRAIAIRNGNSQLTTKGLRAILALTMAVPSETISTADLVNVAEDIARGTKSASFRAHHDGAAHWAIDLNFGGPTIVTLSQLDDQSDVALVTLCLAMMLLSYCDEVSADVLSNIPPTRTEANIQVVSHGEAKKNISLEAIGLTEMPDSSAVSRTTNPKQDASLPIVVFARGDLTSSWLIGKNRGNSGQILFAKVIVELAYHLYAGEIELDLLYPKVIALVKKTVI